MNRFALTVFALLAATSPLMASPGSGDVIGQLGQTLQTSYIYSKASTNARVYYRAKAYDYLILRKTSSSAWLAVVMENGQLGYISSKKVAQLPYNVTAKNVKAPVATADQNAKAAIANYGLKYTGTPYKWGGNDLRNGIDCSGFVQQLFGKIGIELPRTAAEQAMVGKKIERLEDLLPGDRLYFWDRKRGKIGHTGIYLGNGFFVHSSTNNHGVATDDLSEPKWRNMLVAARR